MPIYEYSCPSCGHRFEKLIRNAADLPKSCPACGQPQLKKLFSTFAAKVAAPAAGGCRRQDACPAAHVCSGGCCGGHG